jgi:hypothetical protein
MIAMGMPFSKKGRQMWKSDGCTRKEPFFKAGNEPNLHFGGKK